MTESSTPKATIVRHLGDSHGRRRTLPLGVSSLIFAASLLSSPATGATFMVTNLNNAMGGSLRAAMNSAISSPGGDIVAFDPGLSGTITLVTALPVITGTNADATEIRGETANDAGSGPDITIDGAGLGFEGIVVGSDVDNCVVRGLRVVGCSNGFVVRGALATTPTANALGGPGGRHLNVATGNSNGVLVEGNQLTTLIANMHCISNSANGVVVRNGATSVVFGGPGANEFNVFSGNTQHGVLITGTSTTDVDNITLAYSLIGLDRNGITPLSNLGDGVRMIHSGTGTIHNVVLKENTISGNAGNGVTLGFGVRDVDLDGNRIGTDLTGTLEAHNDQHGVEMLFGATTIEFRNPLLSGVGPNIVSGNLGGGIVIQDDWNTVDGCYIGVGASGSLALGNGLDGVLITGAADDTQVLNCVISSNGRNAVHCAEGTTSTEVSLCWIGTDITAVSSLGNGTAPRTGGVLIGGIAGGDPMSGGPSSNNLIVSNMIGGHDGADQFGIGIFGASSTNYLDTNWIGTNNGGVSFLPNRFGIWVSSGTTSTYIDGNLISWSLSHGIRLEGDINRLWRNKIGTDLVGMVDHPNADSGIYVSGASNVIGGRRSMNEGNQISGNWKWGIEAHNYSGSGFYTLDIGGNDIGVASDGSALENGLGGVWIGQGFRNCQIGDPLAPAIIGDEANTIAYNGGAAGVGDPGAGVVVGETGAGTNEPHTVTIQTNSIFENAGEGIEIDYYSPAGNKNIARPTITSAAPTLIEGSIGVPVSPVSIVQLFTDSADEGQTYLGQVNVTGTIWSFTPTSSLALGVRVTATHTAEIDGTNHTSEFSEPMFVSIAFVAPTLVVSVLPDLGGGAVAKTVLAVASPLTSTSVTLVGGEMIDPNDGTRLACLWESSNPLTDWTDFLDLGPGTVNDCTGTLLTAAMLGGQTGEESTGQPAIWAWDPNLPTQLTVLPTTEPGGAGEVLGLATTGTSTIAGGWSEVGGVHRASLWMCDGACENTQDWSLSNLSGGDPTAPSRVNSVTADSLDYNYLFAGGSVTTPGGATIPYVWEAAYGWQGHPLPLPSGSGAGEVMASHSDYPQYGYWQAGWHRTNSGQQRAAVWTSSDGGASWMAEDAGSLQGDPESILHASYGDVVLSGQMYAAGASIAGDGSERAFISYDGGLGFESYDLNDLTVGDEGFYVDLERVLGFYVDLELTSDLFVGRARSINPLRGSVPVAFIATEIDPADVPEPPLDTKLPSALTLSAEPNPFGSVTTIRFELPVASRIRLTVHDVGGRELSTLMEEDRIAGAHVISWNGRSPTGRALPQGVYFLRLQAGAVEKTSRIVRR